MDTGGVALLLVWDRVAPAGWWLAPGSKLVTRTGAAHATVHREGVEAAVHTGGTGSVGGREAMVWSP